MSSLERRLSRLEEMQEGQQVQTLVNDCIQLCEDHDIPVWELPGDVRGDLEACARFVLTMPSTEDEQRACEVVMDWWATRRGLDREAFFQEAARMAEERGETWFYEWFRTTP